MNHLEKKIQLLHDQRKKLDERLNKLLQDRNKVILKVLDKLPSSALDTATLIGGLMDVCERATQDQTQAEVWRQAGATFCSKRSAKQHFKRSSSQSVNPPTKAA
jgi:Conjugal transfer protein TraD